MPEGLNRSQLFLSLVIQLSLRNKAKYDIQSCANRDSYNYPDFLFEIFYVLLKGFNFFITHIFDLFSSFRVKKKWNKNNKNSLERLRFFPSLLIALALYLMLFCKRRVAINLSRQNRRFESLWDVPQSYSEIKLHRDHKN